MRHGAVRPLFHQNAVAIDDVHIIVRFCEHNRWRYCSCSIAPQFTRSNRACPKRGIPNYTSLQSSMQRWSSEFLARHAFASWPAYKTQQIPAVGILRIESTPHSLNLHISRTASSMKKAVRAPKSPRSAGICPSDTVNNLKAV